MTKLSAFSGTGANGVVTDLQSADRVYVESGGVSKAIDVDDLSGALTAFTPVVEGVTTAGAPTYVTQSGNFVRNGRQVAFQFRVQISAKGGMSGNVRIDISDIGLTIGVGLTSVSVTALNGLAGASSIGSVTGYISGQYILFRYTSASVISTLTDADITDVFDVLVSCVFIVS